MAPWMSMFLHKQVVFQITMSGSRLLMDEIFWKLLLDSRSNVFFLSKVESGAE